MAAEHGGQARLLLHVAQRCLLRDECAARRVVERFVAEFGASLDPSTSASEGVGGHEAELGVELASASASAGRGQWLAASSLTSRARTRSGNISRRRSLFGARMCRGSVSPQVFSSLAAPAPPKPNGRRLQDDTAPRFS